MTAQSAVAMSDQATTAQITEANQVRQGTRVKQAGQAASAKQTAPAKHATRAAQASRRGQVTQLLPGCRGERTQPSVPKVTLTHCEELQQQFNDRRAALGTSDAIREWIEPAMQAWITQVDAHTDELDTASMERLAVAMKQVLAVRDALIVSLVANPEKIDFEQLMAFATKPHETQNRALMKSLLSESFEHLRPDDDRCHAGLNMLAMMADRLPTPYDVQPLAVIAYTLWYMGDARSAVVALHCLDKDEDCSLAALVFSAVDRGVKPAWAKS